MDALAPVVPDPRIPAETARLTLSPAREGIIERHDLLARMERAPGGSLIAVAAPAGYGKSTLLQQFARRSGRAVYLRLDTMDDDPVRLLSGIGAGVGRWVSLPASLIRELQSPSTNLRRGALPEVLDHLASVDQSLVIILDDSHRVTARESAEVLAWLSEHLPPSIRLVLGGRRGPPFPIARQRLQERLLELRASDLAFRHGEVVALAQMLGQVTTDHDVRALLDRSGGWPAAIYLSLRSKGDGPTPDRPDEWQARISDFVREELLDPLDPGLRTWLRRVAVLDPISGDQCDALLGGVGALRRLRELERGDLFVVPQDADRTVYRIHPLLRRVLLDELDEFEPGARRQLRIVASHSAEAVDDIDLAADYAILAGDLDTLAGIIGRHAVRLYWQGRIATLLLWFERFDTDGVREQRAVVAILCAWCHALEGRTQRALVWLGAAEASPETGPMADGTADRWPWIAMLRALMVTGGRSAAHMNAQVAETGMAPTGFFWQFVPLSKAGNALMDGDLAEARVRALEAVDAAGARGDTTTGIVALGLVAAIAMEQDDPHAARAVVEDALQAVERSGLDSYLPSALAYATGARWWAAQGDQMAARELLARFDRLRPWLTDAFPWLSVSCHLQVIQARLRMADAKAARAEMRDIERVLRTHRDLGWLGDAARRVAAFLRDAPLGQEGWDLTTAELRVLAFLPSHLSTKDIAARLFVSPHTVKSQMMSIYSKVGASNRRQAIEAAIEAGLLDASVLHEPVVTPRER